MTVHSGARIESLFADQEPSTNEAVIDSLEIRTQQFINRFCYGFNTERMRQELDERIDYACRVEPPA